MRRRARYVLPLMLGLILAAYVATYAVLSRRGFAEAERYDTDGFYYLTPEKTDRWVDWNLGCAYLFAPLNALDVWLGTGRSACTVQPLFDLS